MRCCTTTRASNTKEMLTSGAINKFHVPWYFNPTKPPKRYKNKFTNTRAEIFLKKYEIHSLQLTGVNVLETCAEQEVAWNPLHVQFLPTTSINLTVNSNQTPSFSLAFFTSRRSCCNSGFYTFARTFLTPSVVACKHENSLLDGVALFRNMAALFESVTKSNKPKKASKVTRTYFV